MNKLNTQEEPTYVQLFFLLALVIVVTITIGVTTGAISLPEDGLLSALLPQH